MDRRRVLQRLATGMATAVGVGLAGCTGNGGDGDGGAARTLDDGKGAVAESSVDGLEVVAAESAIQNGTFTVTVTVENVGEQAVELTGYTLAADFYDEAGSSIRGTYKPSEFPDGRQVEPGETGREVIHFEPDGEPEQIAEYELVLACHENLDGVYCE